MYELSKYILKRKNDSIFLFKTLVFQHYYKICFIVNFKSVNREFETGWEFHKQNILKGKPSNKF